MVRYLYSAVLALLVLMPLTPQVRLRPEGRLNLTYGLFRVPESDPTVLSVLIGELGLSATSPEVRSELMVRFMVSDPTQTHLARAWVRARLGEDARFTVGLARVSWGQGAFFNSGDVIYGSRSLTTDLSAAEFRDDASPMLAFYQDLDEVSFFELVVLPPALAWQAGQLVSGEWDTAAAGGRLVVTLPEDITGLRMEGGYIFRGQLSQPLATLSQGHNVYGAVQGSLWGLANIYGAACLAIDPNDPSWESTQKTLSVSAGLFRLWSLEEGASFSLRLEGLVEASPQPPALSGFWELGFSPDSKGTLSARGLFHSDTSALMLLGWVQKMYQGLTAQILVQAQFGESSDVFGWNRPNDIGILLKIEYLLR